jgi:transposase
MGQARYTEEFKREAVRQVTEKGHPVKEVAERLGMSSYSLYEWIKKYGPGKGAQASRLANKDDEIRRLRTELKRMTEERNILRKAAAYFAKASG